MARMVPHWRTSLIGRLLCSRCALNKPCALQMKSMFSLVFGSWKSSILAHAAAQANGFPVNECPWSRAYSVSSSKNAS